MLVKRTAWHFGIALFWCVMNFLLIQRQSAAPPPVLTLSGGEKITARSEEWWGIFYRGEKIGYATQTITPVTTASNSAITPGSEFKSTRHRSARRDTS